MSETAADGEEDEKPEERDDGEEDGEQECCGFAGVFCIVLQGDEFLFDNYHVGRSWVVLI